MRIGGIQPLSLVDFPGTLSAVVFTVGCNFRCPFCHNIELVNGTINTVDESIFFDFLSNRIHKLEGVVISGGEPTIHNDLPEFIKKVRMLGYKIKLDTNGTNPKLLETLMLEGVLDFVAMDIKHVLSKYDFATNSKINEKNIIQSINLLINGNVNYEFRTTVIKNFHKPEDIVSMSKQICGAKHYVVQEFIPKKTLDENFSKQLPFDKDILESLTCDVLKNVKSFEIRQ